MLVGGERDNGRLHGPAAGAAARGPRGGGMLEDERLTRRAWERLAERGILDSRVDITTVDGVMYLRGRPRDAREASAVVEIAETTPGVERVVNELKALEPAQ
jgi:osmotically-inducible protein OsmY